MFGPEPGPPIWEISVARARKTAPKSDEAAPAPEAIAATEVLPEVADTAPEPPETPSRQPSIGTGLTMS